MTYKSIIEKLLTGAVVCKRQSGDKRFNHGLYEGNKSLAGIISDKQMKRLHRVLKVHKSGYVISIQLVRRQHGRSTEKQVYKSFKHKSNGSNSTKTQA